MSLLTPADRLVFGAYFVALFAVLFAVCTAALVAVSIATLAPDAPRVAPLTIGHHAGAPKEAAPRGDVVLSALLLALVAAAWLYFS